MAEAVAVAKDDAFSRSDRQTVLALALCIAGALCGAILLRFALLVTIQSFPAPAIELRAHDRVSVPPLALPGPTDPMARRAVSPDEARIINAKIPFITGSFPPAAAFHLAANGADREAATTCLASALWYEAGPDKVGQQAVAQVILNRVRHPAFPKTICGVVFQGSERNTGCQFSFTCNGALTRKPPEDAWRDARHVASAALTGFVFKPVGLATHYHTDWVAPYWSVTLDKLAQVHSHIFYRWTGWWGTRPAFSGRYAGSEGLDPRILPLADASKLPGPVVQPEPVAAQLAVVAPTPALQIEGMVPERMKGALVRLFDLKSNIFVLDVSQVHFAGDFAMAALDLCSERAHCEVIGWSNLSTLPARLPLEAASLQQAAFIYEKNEQAGVNHALWNCTQFPRADTSQCMASRSSTQIALATPLP